MLDRIRLLIDWPRHDIRCYRQYLYACHHVGLPIGMVEMMDWGCRAFNKIGIDDSKIPEMAGRLYWDYEHELPRNHDAERVIELMIEVIELTYYGYLDEFMDFFRIHRNVWVAHTCLAGVVLETEVLNGWY